MAWIFLLIAFFLAFAGYLIRFRKRVDLIAGYRRGAFRNEAARGRWVGNRLFASAGMGLIIATTAAGFKDLGLYLFMGYIAIVVLGAMFSDFSAERFEGSNSNH